MPLEAADFDFLDPEERTALFIDGVSIHAAARNLQWVIDFKRLRSFFAERTRLMKAFYFTPLDIHDENRIAPLVGWLEFNGFSCQTIEYDSTDERTRQNIDVLYAVEVMSAAAEVDHLILFTGAGRFVPVLRYLDRKCKKVTICSTMQQDARMVSQELRRLTDHFIDLNDIRSEIQRR